MRILQRRRMRLVVPHASELLLQVLAAPEAGSALGLDDWNSLLRAGRRTGLLARIGADIQQAGACGRLHEKVREQLCAAVRVAEHHQRGVRWELNRICRELQGTGVVPVLLKGTAYVMADLPVARGRVSRDIDLLVPRDNLAAVESSLRDHGWLSLDDDEYDDFYYRAWMHELPPLRHCERGTVIDVHHAILPRTGRLHPDSDLLLQAARPVAGGVFRVLSPEDMWLHSAAHLFQDGDLHGGLRDVTDLDLMLRHFGEHEPGFWDRLVPRAEQLQLGRPLFYAIRFTKRLLQTPVPREVMVAAQAHAPSWLVGPLMDRLALRVLVPDMRDGESWSQTSARLLLYIRSHWLRMPPALLARHLTRKALKRWRRKKEE